MGFNDDLLNLCRLNHLEESNDDPEVQKAIDWKKSRIVTNLKLAPPESMEAEEQHTTAAIRLSVESPATVRAKPCTTGSPKLPDWNEVYAHLLTLRPTVEDSLTSNQWFARASYDFIARQIRASA